MSHNRRAKKEKTRQHKDNAKQQSDSIYLHIHKRNEITSEPRRPLTPEVLQVHQPRVLQLRSDADYKVIKYSCYDISNIYRAGQILFGSWRVFLFVEVAGVLQ